jgi:adenosylhomocysteine nucleosidase
MPVDYLVVASSLLELEGFLTKVDEIQIHKGRSFVLVCVGVGKVQSAVLTCKAIATYGPKAVLCVGYAGALDPTLLIGDCVLASSVLQYDVDLRAFRLKRGELPSPVKGETIGSLPLYCPPLEDTVSRVGGTADLFLLRAYREENPWLTEELHLGFADMESYAVAFACKQMQIKLTVCRVISDDAQGHRPKKFKDFCLLANTQFVRILEALLDSPQ